jgi:parallel beta-helix repeat protein
MAGGGEGAYFDGAKDSKILGCSFLNNEYGIYTLNSPNAEIIENEFNSSNLIDIEILETSPGTEITENIFNGGNNTKNAIWLYSSNNAISRNTIDNYTDAIVLFYGANNTGIANNTISNSRLGGIITHGWNLLIENNELRSIGGTAISIGRDFGGPGSIGMQNNITVRNNNLSSCGMGIYLDGAKKNVIENNKIRGAIDYALNGQSDQGNIIRGNRLTNSGRGINLDYGNNTQIINNSIFNNSVGIYTNLPTNISMRNNSICGNVLDVNCGGGAATIFTNNKCGQSGYVCGGYCQECSLQSLSPFAGFWNWVEEITGFLLR